MINLNMKLCTASSLMAIVLFVSICFMHGTAGELIQDESIVFNHLGFMAKFCFRQDPELLGHIELLDVSSSDANSTYITLFVDDAWDHVNQDEINCEEKKANSKMLPLSVQAAKKKLSEGFKISIPVANRVHDHTYYLAAINCRQTTTELTFSVHFTQAQADDRELSCDALPLSTTTNQSPTIPSSTTTNQLPTTSNTTTQTGMSTTSKSSMQSTTTHTAETTSTSTHTITSNTTTYEPIWTTSTTTTTPLYPPPTDCEPGSNACVCKPGDQCNVALTILSCQNTTHGPLCLPLECPRPCLKPKNKCPRSGKLGCQCRDEWLLTCEKGSKCDNAYRDGLCVPCEEGTVGCTCKNRILCEDGSTCSDNVCVRLTTTTTTTTWSLNMCLPGTDLCDCTVDKTCENDEFVCKQNGDQQKCLPRFCAPGVLGCECNTWNDCMDVTAKCDYSFQEPLCFPCQPGTIDCACDRDDTPSCDKFLECKQVRTDGWKYKCKACSKGSLNCHCFSTGECKKYLVCSADGECLPEMHTTTTQMAPDHNSNAPALIIGFGSAAAVVVAVLFCVCFYKHRKKQKIEQVVRA